jgi:hypothetical protein
MEEGVTIAGGNEQNGGDEQDEKGDGAASAEALLGSRSARRHGDTVRGWRIRLGIVRCGGGVSLIAIH